MMWIVFAGKELLRKKIVLIASVLTLFYLVLFNYVLSKMTVHPEGILRIPFQSLIAGVSAMTLGLMFAGMIVAFVVFFATMGTISGESENGLMLAVLARPIPRWKLYLGKYFGMTFWLLLYSSVMYAAILFSVHQAADLPLLWGSAVKAWLLFIWGPLLLLAISLLGSVYLPMLANGVACASLYGLGLFCGFAEGLYNMHGGNDTLSSFSMGMSLLIPSNALFSRMTYEIIGGLDLPLLGDLLNQLGPFTPLNAPSPVFIAYTIVYLAVLLALGCRAFGRKDMI
jgi:ABC-type transport system involved in multi-copper enzyme maturation permease subunit